MSLDLKGRGQIDECMERISAAGIILAMVDNRLECSDPEAAQAIIDGYTLAEAKAWKAAKIATHAKALRDRAIALYSPAEMASWPIKLAEARAFAETGDPASAPMLSAEAAVRGVTLEQMLAKVSSNAEQFAWLEATISGIDGRHRDAVKALETFQEIADYDFSGGWPAV